MGNVKTFALNLDIDILQSIIKDKQKIFESLNTKSVPKYFIDQKEDSKYRYYEIILLAYLDAMGFANRSNTTIDKLFPRVLERYLATILHFQEAKNKIDLKIGKSEIYLGSALKLPIEDQSVDAIITSPPYSFAIDYLKNDQPQLEYLGADLKIAQE